VRPELTLRDTFYTQTQIFTAQPDGTLASSAEDNVLNRKALEVSFELRPPALSRVFERPLLGIKWKHVIEPRMRYDYATGVNNFANVLRFDATDILSDTNNIEYSIVNRLYAKRVNAADDTKDCEQQGMRSLNIGGAPPSSVVPWETSAIAAAPVCPAGPREVLTWEVGQKYYFDQTFGHALILGHRNVFTSTADFTGIAFLNDMRRFSPIISRLRIETSPRTNTEWDLDYDLKTGRINASTALLNYHYGAFTIGGGDAFLRVTDTTQGDANPPQRDYNQYRLLFGYGQPQKRGFSGAASFGFDQNQGFLQYSTAQITHNWDCCGVSIEYRRFALGLVRNENQFRFAFSLANVGAFGNLKRQERLY
jgi:LPS-assembly protein